MHSAGWILSSFPSLLFLFIGLGVGDASPAQVTDASPAPSTRVSAVHDAAAATLSFAVDGKEAFVYQHQASWAIPHIWPLRSPTGRPLTVQRTEPFPHHRSLWVVDRVQLEDGPVTDFYHEWSNLRDAERPELGHHSYIRHDCLVAARSGEHRASARAELTWIVKGDVPVLGQALDFELEDLGEGEYILNLSWALRATYGDVKFLSDWVHYAWPYLRMDPTFSGEQGGTIVDNLGRRGQAETNEKYAAWIDYSNTIDGVTEGLAVLLPADGQPRKWLTREYGTFGPRRPDEWSGTNFTLKRGETLAGEVAILVHKGDAKGGRVAERYAAWITQRVSRAR